MSAPSKTVKAEVAKHSARRSVQEVDEELLGIYLLARNGRGGSSARGLRAVFAAGQAKAWEEGRQLLRDQIDSEQRWDTTNPYEASA